MTVVADLARVAAPFAERLNLDRLTIDESGSNNNGFVLYQNGFMRMRLVSEKNLSFAEIASLHEPDTWFDLSLIMNDRLGLSLTTIQPVDAQLSFAVDHQLYLQQLMTKDLQTCKDRVQQAERQRFKAMFPGINPIT